MAKYVTNVMAWVYVMFVLDQECVLYVMATMSRHRAIIATTAENVLIAGAKVHVLFARVRDTNRIHAHAFTHIGTIEILVARL